MKSQSLLTSKVDAALAKIRAAHLKSKSESNDTNDFMRISAVSDDNKNSNTFTQKALGSIASVVSDKVTSMPTKDAHVSGILSRADALASKLSEDSTQSIGVSLQRATDNQLSRKQKKELNSKTTGPKWFDMAGTQVTPEIARDLKLIQLRNVLDPKRFYKKDQFLLKDSQSASANGNGNAKNAKKAAPVKYFQIGRIIDSPTDAATNRLTNKQRRKEHIVDDLLADADKAKYFKQKFLAVQFKKKSDRGRGSQFTRKRGGVKDATFTKSLSAVKLK